MRAPLVLASLLIASCAHGGRPTPDRVRPTPDAASSCAFESLDALCESFREQYVASGADWVAEGCGYGDRQHRSGAFAEALLVGVRVGHGGANSGPLVERPLLTTTVREPAAAEGGGTMLVLAARVGSRWFPLWLWSGGVDGTSQPAPSFEWSLAADGDRIAWTLASSSGDRASPPGYGSTERTVVVAHDGVPMIGATATVESWRSDVDTSCVRRCYGPPASERAACEASCASSIVTTRAWTESGGLVRIGASETVVEGHAARDVETAPAHAAEQRRLDDRATAMGVCGFTPVVHAVPTTTLPTDPESVAARARVMAQVRAGSWIDVPGASAVVDENTPRSIIEVYGVLGGGCGGGGCSTAVRYRTVEGAMPEAGVQYFTYERGPQGGCHADALPRTGDSGAALAPTILEVALASAGTGIGCGFTGFDGTTNRTWVVTRILAPR